MSDEQLENFRRHMQAELDTDLSVADAKGRYLELLHLFWVLGHEPPRQEEPREDPPTPPWL